mgnify:FL=1|tara:strand:+ start:2362 stop:2646 length:285 start_codon:yes stop_codon:yes gene_type:complete
MKDKTLQATVDAVKFFMEKKDDEEIQEGTEHKGTKYVRINTFASSLGQGIQLTQDKRLPGDKRTGAMMGAYVQFPKKDIPLMIKKLQAVLKERN